MHCHEASWERLVAMHMPLRSAVRVRGAHPTNLETMSFYSATEPPGNRRRVANEHHKYE
jgi:hypothetical protein